MIQFVFSYFILFIYLTSRGNSRLSSDKLRKEKSEFKRQKLNIKDVAKKVFIKESPAWCHIHRSEQSRCRRYLEAVGYVEFGCRNSNQIIHQHHDHDGQEDGEVTDG